VPLGSRLEKRLLLLGRKTKVPIWTSWGGQDAIKLGVGDFTDSSESNRSRVLASLSSRALRVSGLNSFREWSYRYWSLSWLVLGH
jgi:hypothetical protein